MMKKSCFLFVFFIYVTGVFAQDNLIKIDYQYKKTDSVYEAYTVALDSLSGRLYFEVVCNLPVNRFLKLEIYEGDSLLESAIELRSDKYEIDSEELKVFKFEIIGSKLKKYAAGCQFLIKVVARRDRYSIKLPFNYCLVKNILVDRGFL